MADPIEIDLNDGGNQDIAEDLIDAVYDMRPIHVTRLDGTVVVLTPTHPDAAPE